MSLTAPKRPRIAASAPEFVVGQEPLSTMPHDKDEPTESVKKQRRGFVVGPENLPDGPWRRKSECTGTVTSADRDTNA